MKILIVRYKPQVPCEKLLSFMPQRAKSADLHKYIYTKSTTSIASRISNRLTVKSASMTIDELWEAFNKYCRRTAAIEFEIIDQVNKGL